MALEKIMPDDMNEVMRKLLVYIGDEDKQAGAKMSYGDFGKLLAKNYGRYHIGVSGPDKCSIEATRQSIRITTLSGNEYELTWNKIAKFIHPYLKSAAVEEERRNRKMSTIKPIETVYNGYRFRSRLEARWAVFFDAAGIEYQYEPEGFDLGDGEWYLPDFYLPKFRIYVEIKRKELSGEELATALEKCEKLFCACPCFVGLFMGDPLDNKMFLYCYNNTASGGGNDWHRCEFISQAETDITLAVEMECDYSPIMNCKFEDFPKWGYCEYPNGYRYSDGTDLYPLDSEYDSCEAVMPTFEINDNYGFSSEKQKARQARFEHGEHGAVSCALNTSRCFTEQNS